MKKVLLAAIAVCFWACGNSNLFAQEKSEYYIPQEKNPGTAFLFSLLVPGMGQMSNDQVGKGFQMMTTCLISGYAALRFIDGSTNIKRDETQIGIAFGVLSLGIWLYSIIDAPITASNMNEEIRRKKENLYRRGLFGSLVNEDINFNIKPYYNYASFGLSLNYNF